MKLLLGFSVVALLGLTACTDGGDTKPMPITYFATTTVNKPVEREYRTFRGIVVPAEQTSISFRLAGEVDQLYVKAGDVVKKGKLLAKLSDSKEKQALVDAKAQFDLATRQLKRGRELFSRQMLARAELDELIASEKLAQANFNFANNQFKYTSLYAPFSGKISETFKERFERTAPGETVLNLYQNNRVQVRVELSDNLLAMVDPEDSIKQRQYKPQVSFSGIAGNYQMHYLEHSTEPNEQTRTYQLFLDMAQPEKEILPGTSATVLVDMKDAGISTISGFNVPLTALQAGSEEGEFFVWKLIDNKATKVAVNVTQINSEGVIVSSGIFEGDKLVNSNLRKLREGAFVNVLEKE